MNRRYRILIGSLICLALVCAVALAETFSYFGQPVPLTQDRECGWELTIKDAQEYLYEDFNTGETLKKITSVDIYAYKPSGTDYFGYYTGKGTITVFNAVSPDEDAYPVLYGGQAADTMEFILDFVIDKKTNILIPSWEFSPIEDRSFDGISTLQYSIRPDTVRGVFREVADWPGLAGAPGVEFQNKGEIAILYTDGGYVSLTFQRHWQIPAPFKGMLIGVTAGGRQVGKALLTPVPAVTQAPGNRVQGTPTPTATDEFIDYRRPDFDTLIPLSPSPETFTPAPTPTDTPINYVFVTPNNDYSFVTPTPTPATTPTATPTATPRRDLIINTPGGGIIFVTPKPTTTPTPSPTPTEFIK